MTDPQVPPHVRLNGDRGAHRVSDAAFKAIDPEALATPEPRREIPPGGIDVEWFSDDPTDAVLVVLLPNGNLEEVPLSEMRLARLRAALDSQADAVAQMRWEVAGGDPAEYVPDTADESTQPHAADEVNNDSVDDSEDESEGIARALDRKTRKLRDPFSTEPAIKDLQKRTYRGVSVEFILFGLLGVAVLLALIYNIVVGM